ncbi:hypothetical protein ACH5RR_037190 [Cinchona calisaya]|uniref:Uncharacterized protein n=1 Tax=Cinchona calisaya TaxID=153742 RepID=A0ABD2Y6T6_9GENT
MFSSYNEIGRRILEYRHSTEARNENAQPVLYNCSLEVNFTSTIEEIVANENYDLLLYNTSINNSLLNSDGEAEGEDIEQGESISYEEPLSSKFTNIEGVTNATIDILTSSKEAGTPLNDRELYKGQRFATKKIYRM